MYVYVNILNFAVKRSLRALEYHFFSWQHDDVQASSQEQDSLETVSHYCIVIVLLLSFLILNASLVLSIYTLNIFLMLSRHSRSTLSLWYPPKHLPVLWKKPFHAISWSKHCNCNPAEVARVKLYSGYDDCWKQITRLYIIHVYIYIHTRIYVYMYIYKLSACGWMTRFRSACLKRLFVSKLEWAMMLVAEGSLFVPIFDFAVNNIFGVAETVDFGGDCLVKVSSHPSHGLFLGPIHWKQSQFFGCLFHTCTCLVPRMSFEHKKQASIHQETEIQIRAILTVLYRHYVPRRVCIYASSKVSHFCVKISSLASWAPSFLSFLNHMFERHL